MAVATLQHPKWGLQKGAKTCCFANSIYNQNLLLRNKNEVLSSKLKLASFCCSHSIFFTSFPFSHKKKAQFEPFWRRERDSNPRTCYSQQFSRLPHSTALPSLRGKCRAGNRNMQKIMPFY